MVLQESIDQETRRRMRDGFSGVVSLIPPNAVSEESSSPLYDTVEAAEE